MDTEITMPVQSTSEQKQIVKSANNNQELQDKIDWLRKRIDESIDKVSQRTVTNQRKASSIKLFTLILAGSATILLGLQIPTYEEYFNSIAFVFTAIVALMSTVEPFFNYRAMWVEHERAEYKFRLLKDDLDFYVAGTRPEKLTIEKIQTFHERFQQIWSDLSESWLEQRESGRFSI